jgi:hypothetical protein
MLCYHAKTMLHTLVRISHNISRLKAKISYITQKWLLCVKISRNAPPLCHQKPVLL